MRRVAVFFLMIFSISLGEASGDLQVKLTYLDAANPSEFDISEFLLEEITDRSERESPPALFWHLPSGADDYVDFYLWKSGLSFETKDSRNQDLNGLISEPIWALTEFAGIALKHELQMPETGPGGFGERYDLEAARARAAQVFRFSPTAQEALGTIEEEVWDAAVRRNQVHGLRRDQVTAAVEALARLDHELGVDFTLNDYERIARASKAFAAQDPRAVTIVLEEVVLAILQMVERPNEADPEMADQTANEALRNIGFNTAWSQLLTTLREWKLSESLAKVLEYEDHAAIDVVLINERDALELDSRLLGGMGSELVATQLD